MQHIQKHQLQTMFVLCYHTIIFFEFVVACSNLNLVAYKIRLFKHKRMQVA